MDPLYPPALDKNRAEIGLYPASWICSKCSGKILYTTLELATAAENSSGKKISAAHLDSTATER